MEHAPSTALVLPIVFLGRSRRSPRDSTHPASSAPTSDRISSPRLGPDTSMGGARSLPDDAAILAEARGALPGVDGALSRSVRVGDLLLKNETQELVQVREWASDLHAGAAVMQQREVPCGAERDACVGCYQANAADPLRCAGEVAAYEKCARLAQKAVVAQ